MVEFVHWMKALNQLVFVSNPTSESTALMTRAVTIRVNMEAPAYWKIYRELIDILYLLFDL